jgi:chromosome segregation ATPase
LTTYEQKELVKEQVHEIQKRVENISQEWERFDENLSTFELEDAASGQDTQSKVKVLLVDFERLGLSKTEVLDGLRKWFEEIEMTSEQMRFDAETESSDFDANKVVKSSDKNPTARPVANLRTIFDKMKTVCEAEVRRISSNTAEYKDEAKALKKERKELDKLMLKHKDATTTLGTRLQVSDAHILALKSEGEKKNKEWKFAVQEFEDRILFLERQLAQEEGKNRVSEMRSRTQGLELELQVKQTESSSQDTGALEETIDKLKEELADVKKLLKTKSVMSDDLANQLKREKEESSMKVKMFAADVRKEKLKLDDAHKRELEELQHQLEASKEQMSQRMEQFKAEIENQKRIASSTEAVDSLQSEHEAEMQRIKSKLQQAQDDAKSANESFYKSKSELDQLSSNVKQLENANSQLSKDKEAAEKAASEAQSTAERAVEDAAAATEEAQKVAGEAANVAAANSQPPAPDNSAEIDALNAAKEALQNSLQECKDNLGGLQGKYDTLANEQAAALRELKDVHAKEIAELTERVKEESTVQTAAVDEGSEATAQAAEEERLQSNDEMDALKASLAQAKAQTEQLQQELQQQRENAAAELNAATNKAKETAEKVRAQSEERIRKVQEQIQKEKDDKTALEVKLKALAEQKQADVPVVVETEVKPDIVKTEEDSSAAVNINLAKVEEEFEACSAKLAAALERIKVLEQQLADLVREREAAEATAPEVAATVPIVLEVAAEPEPAPEPEAAAPVEAAPVEALEVEPVEIPAPEPTPAPPEEVAEPVVVEHVVQIEAVTEDHSEEMAKLKDDNAQLQTRVKELVAELEKLRVSNKEFSEQYQAEKKQSAALRDILREEQESLTRRLQSTEGENAAFQRQFAELQSLLNHVEDYLEKVSEEGHTTGVDGLLDKVGMAQKSHRASVLERAAVGKKAVKKNVKMLKMAKAFGGGGGGGGAFGGGKKKKGVGGMMAAANSKPAVDQANETTTSSEKVAAEKVAAGKVAEHEVTMHKGTMGEVQEEAPVLDAESNTDVFAIEEDSAGDQSMAPPAQNPVEVLNDAEGNADVFAIEDDSAGDQSMAPPTTGQKESKSSEIPKAAKGKKMRR